MNFRFPSIKARLWGSVSAIALMAGCSGPIDPNGSITLGLNIGTGIEPEISVTGEFVVGKDPKVEKGIKPLEEEEAAENAALTDNVVYLFHEGTVRNRPVAPELMSTLSNIVATKLPPGTKINVTSGGQDAKGEGPNRTGSTRHDVDEHGHGRAVDLFLTVNGNKALPDTHPDLYSILIYEAAKFFPGIGYYSWGIHIGYGVPAFWGPDTTSKTASPDFREAYLGGREAA